MIRRDRLSATMDAPFVVFLIGMRINKPWKIHKWWPVAQAMPRMLAELRRCPDLGMLGGEMWFGRTTILVQYWRTMEQLLAYAKDRDAMHLPAWKAFNHAVGPSGDVGVWHETYAVSGGGYENIYVNMPPFGLGKFGTLTPATGAMISAEGRLRAGDRRVPWASCTCPHNCTDIELYGRGNCGGNLIVSRLLKFEFTRLPHDTSTS